MRKLVGTDRMYMQATILYILSQSMDDDTAIRIADTTDRHGVTLMDAVIKDITESSEWEATGEYNDDDVRLAVGRVMSTRLGLQVI